MLQLLRSADFDKWLKGLKDGRAIARIAARLRSFEFGNLGDCKAVKGSVWELRIHYGPSYRIYYTQQGQITYLLLVGGTKSSQRADINEAVRLANEILKEQKQ
jgi:putative addiction module killer protein